MAVVLHPSGRARFPLCTGIIEMSGTCQSAGPFFMSRPATGKEVSTSRLTNGEGCRMTLHGKDIGKNKDTGEVAANGRAKETRHPAFSRKRVVSRLWRTAERQVAEIETRMAGLGDDPQALERDAKILAIIAKTVRDLVALDGEALNAHGRSKSKEQAPAHGSKSAQTDPLLTAEPDAAEFGPRDIEQFRTELARRLDELRRERAGGETP